MQQWLFFRRLKRSMLKCKHKFPRLTVHAFSDTFMQKLYSFGSFSISFLLNRNRKAVGDGMIIQMNVHTITK